MEEAEIRQRLTSAIADIFKVDPHTLTGSTTFVQDLKARSLTMVALVAAVESEFRIKTTARETNKNKTIDDTVTYIQQKLREKEQPES